MSAKQTGQPSDPAADGWMTTAEICARVWGLSPSTFARQVRPRAAPEHIHQIRQAGRVRQVLYFCPGVLADYLAATLAEAQATAADPIYGDQDNETGTPSAGLERYRQARADLAELELAQRRNQWIPRDEVHAGLEIVAGALRTAGEILRRNYGPDAAAVLDDAISLAQTEVANRWAAEKGAP